MQTRRQAIEDLVKRRFFYVPSFEIYGGVKGLYDFGPPGAAMMTELTSFWRDFFILEENMLQIDTRTMTPESVFVASGHVAKFEDKMVRDSVTGDCYRADHLLEDTLKPLGDEYATILAQAGNYSIEELGEQLKRFQVKAPETGNDLSDPFPFNLMFSTQIGPTGKQKGYLRPETAQGMFYNFPRLLDYNAGRLPFAAAQIGPAFRNEIAPRNGLLRVREFTLAEIEHFVDPRDKSHPKFSSVQGVVLPLYPRDAQLGDKKIRYTTIGEAVASGLVDNETLGYFLVRDYQFLKAVGIRPEGLRFRQHLANEMAHYASDCWDAEIETSYGWIECIGNADRSCYDLRVHEKATGLRMKAFVPYPDGPRDVEITTVLLNKKLLGYTFKQAQRKVTSYFESIKESQETIGALKEELAKSGRLIIEGLELTPDMISFVTEIKKCDGENIQPSVIEPSFGLGRIMYSILEHTYYLREGEDEMRAVLRLPPIIAPIKVAVLPLMAKPELVSRMAAIERLLTKAHLSCRSDASGAAIGRKYARMDEIGIPFAVTIDYETLEKDTVTLRYRDSMKQLRLPIDDLVDRIKLLIDSSTTFAQ